MQVNLLQYKWPWYQRQKIHLLSSQTLPDWHHQPMSSLMCVSKVQKRPNVRVHDWGKPFENCTLHINVHHEFDAANCHGNQYSTLLICLHTWKIRLLVLISGRGNSIFLSILPGRSRAGSRLSILFVARITFTSPLESKPSNWFSNSNIVLCISRSPPELASYL